MAENYIDDRYVFTKQYIDDFVSPDRVRYGRWRPPKLDMLHYGRSTVKPAEIGRIDLIAHRVYGDVRLWPIVAYYNGIKNAFEDMYPGQVLVLPLLSEIQTASEPIQ